MFRLALPRLLLFVALAACTAYDPTSPGATLRGRWALVAVDDDPLPDSAFLSQCSLDAGGEYGVLTGGTLTLAHERIFGQPYRLAGTLALTGTGTAQCASDVVIEAPTSAPPYVAEITTPERRGVLAGMGVHVLLERIEQPHPDTLQMIRMTFVRQP